MSQLLWGSQCRAFVEPSTQRLSSENNVGVGQRRPANHKGMKEHFSEVTFCPCLLQVGLLTSFSKTLEWVFFQHFTEQVSQDT